VPAGSVPEWLKQRILGNPVNNLGAYVRPQYRDVTYFYGIDFHQDLIDYKQREADFLTLYIYLHPVTRADAPLYLLAGSHKLGGSVFPHNLSRIGDSDWLYRNAEHGEVVARQRILTGETGFAAIWHACTLHGTKPDAADHERISLRYLVARRHDGPTGLDAVNAKLQGPLSLSDTRADLAADGSAAIRRNTVNQA
jgi:ectoine hydroxylase-related dioxygenase (phytanoyl-CoA dioxygenase family)